MYGLNEADLVRIRQAFEKESLKEAIQMLEKTLDELGYRRTGNMFRDDRGLAGAVGCPVPVLAS
jgi:hypothetical protein